MAVYDSVVEGDVFSIFSGDKDNPPIKYRWECKLVTEAGEVKALSVSSISLIRDYLSSYGDEMRIDIGVSPGEFDKIITPHRNNIDVVLTRTPVFIDKAGGEVVDLPETRVKRYKGVLDDGRSQALEGNVAGDTDSEIMDLKSIRPVSVTLLDKAVEQLKTVETGGVFRSMRPVDLLRFLFVKLSQSLQLEEGEAVKGVDVVDDVDLAPAFDQFVIKQPTLLKDVHKDLQKTNGVYYTGINRYYQNNIWYIYPTYDQTRFATASRKLTILNMPANMVTGMRKTSRLKDGHLYIVSTEETLSSDQETAKLINEGNGIRYVRAGKLFSGMVSTGGNKAVLSRKDTVVEHIAVKAPNGINHAPMSEEAIASSDAFQISRMAARKGVAVQIGWEASEADKITPGMPVRFLNNMKDGTVQARYGAVIGTQTEVFSDSATVIETSHTSKTSITVFIGHDPEQ